MADQLRRSTGEGPAFVRALLPVDGLQVGQDQDPERLGWAALARFQMAITD